jgi:protein disulfide-isomerase A6
MKPAWDKLGDAYKDSSSVLIADVDCTTDGGKPVCDSRGVQGFPTIKYYTSEKPDGEKYQGGRDFDTLDKFVKENLLAKCDTKTKENCNPKETEYIDKMSAKGKDAIAKEFDRLEKMKGGDMKPEKKAWLSQRIGLLKSMKEGETGSSEL